LSQTKLFIIRISLLTLILLPNIGHSAAVAEKKPVVAHITKYEGTVNTHREAQARSQKVTQSNTNIRINDIVRTKRQSRAFFKLTDHSKIILEENSTIHFRGIQDIGSKQGMVLFDLNERGKLNGLTITNNMAVIGVKGTQFLISTIDNKFAVYMKQGLVSIEAIEGKFKRFKQQQSDKFETFKQKNNQDFNTFKSDLEQEFSEFVKSFELTEGKAITIVGNEVREIAIPDEINNKFLLFEQF